MDEDWTGNGCVHEFAIHYFGFSVELVESV